MLTPLSATQLNQHSPKATLRALMRGVLYRNSHVWQGSAVQTVRQSSLPILGLLARTDSYAQEVYLQQARWGLARDAARAARSNAALLFTELGEEALRAS